MQAIKAITPGGPENLQLLTLPKPILKTAQKVLLKVFATAINRADTLERKGLYPPPPSAADAQGVLGLEAVGVVDELPEGYQGAWKKGDRVMALLGGGGYGEYCVVDHRHLMKVPTSLSWEQGAAIPEVWLTSYQLLHFVAKLRKEDIVLIHGGGSGIGTAATQLIREFGAKSIVTVGSDEKAARCLELQANYAINYKKEDFVQKVQEYTNGKGADVILDCIGEQYWEKNVNSLALDGRWVLYGTMGGGNVNGALLGLLLRKRGQLVASTLRNRDDEYKARLVAAFSEHALPLFEKGIYKPIVDCVFPFDQVAEAHRKMEANANFGKIVLKVRNEE